MTQTLGYNSYIVNRLHINNRSKKWLLLVGLAILLLSGLITWWLLRPQSANQPTTQTKNQPVEEPAKTDNTKSKQELVFSAMGDMLAHDSIVNQAKTTDGYNFIPYFAQIQTVISGSDVVFCNPETPAAGARFGVSGYPTFNAPIEFSRDLNKVGCNLINFATNHIADKGQEAINITLDEWQKLQPLAVAGANRNPADQQRISYFEKNGLKVAFLAFADFSNAQPPTSYSLNNYHDKNLVTKLMTEARQNADFVVISAHWGTEDSHQVNTDQMQTAQAMADLGADVIIGTGPHVLQKVSMLPRPDGGETLVWYSIGNMLSSQLQTDELTGGIAKFNLSKNDGKTEISEIAFVPTFMSYEWSASDRANSLLHTRSNLKLQLLKNAQNETKLFGVTVEERFDKVKQWLGSEVSLSIEL